MKPYRDVGPDCSCSVVLKAQSRGTNWKQHVAERAWELRPWSNSARSRQGASAALLAAAGAVRIAVRLIPEEYSSAAAVLAPFLVAQRPNVCTANRLSFKHVPSAHVYHVLRKKFAHPCHGHGSTLTSFQRCLQELLTVTGAQLS